MDYALGSHGEERIRPLSTPPPWDKAASVEADLPDKHGAPEPLVATPAHESPEVPGG